MNIHSAGSRILVLLMVGLSGFLSLPKKSDGSAVQFPAALRFYGYNQSWGQTNVPPARAMPTNDIVLHVSAHGFELMKDRAYYEDFRKSCRSNGQNLGFDPVQNADPEKSYFCGMTYRVMRALGYYDAVNHAKRIGPTSSPSWSSVPAILKSVRAVYCCRVSCSRGRSIRRSRWRSVRTKSCPAVRFAILMKPKTSKQGEVT